MGYTPPHLEVRKITGGYNVFPPTLTTGDDVYIFPNGTDARPYLLLNGNAGVGVSLPGANYFQLDREGSGFLRINYATPTVTLESIIADKNLLLKTNGTGLLSFGAYTAGAATDSTGYITILDAAGNTRKLMVQA